MSNPIHRTEYIITLPFNNSEVTVFVPSDVKKVGRYLDNRGIVFLAIRKKNNSKS